MHLSVELSMYPLQNDYKAKIKDFLKLLNDSNSGTDNNIEIRTTNMSTRKYLQGDARELSSYQ